MIGRMLRCEVLDFGFSFWKQLLASVVLIPPHNYYRQFPLLGFFISYFWFWQMDGIYYSLFAYQILINLIIS